MHKAVYKNAEESSSGATPDVPLQLQGHYRRGGGSVKNVSVEICAPPPHFKIASVLVIVSQAQCRRLVFMKREELSSFCLAEEIVMEQDIAVISTAKLFKSGSINVIGLYVEVLNHSRRHY